MSVSVWRGRTQECRLVEVGSGEGGSEGRCEEEEERAVSMQGKAVSAPSERIEKRLGRPEHW